MTDNANDRWRAMQEAMLQMSSKIAREHGFDPTAIQVKISLRLPPHPEFITVAFTTEPCFCGLTPQQGETHTAKGCGGPTNRIAQAIMGRHEEER
jgi:hypothetical protein